MKKAELLSPAGSIDAVYQAVHNGADSVYLGGSSFGARAFAANFTNEQMEQAVDFCHLYGVKVFVTVNTLIYQHEIEHFIQNLKTIYKLGADALIIQDIGMMDIARQMLPDIDIHASTQMHNHNDSCLCFAASLGAQRAVLAREMSIEQIQNLKCDIEKEVFVHGALCLCYSGQCLFSALTQDRSGNRGKCAQSCRMKYTLVDAQNMQYKTGYLLSPRDIALFSDVDLLIKAGVDCLKIEGRMKPPEYVGLVTKIYRKLLDGKAADYLDLDNLKKLFNRGFSKGHLLQSKELMNTLRPNHAGVPLGRVISLSNQRIKIELSDTLCQGDGIKFERTDTGFICNRIYLRGKLVSGADSGQIIELENKADAKQGDSVVKTSDTKLIKALGDYEKRKIGVAAKLTAIKNAPLVLEFSDSENTIRTSGDIVAPSRTTPTKDLDSNISKLGNTPFEIKQLNIDSDDDIFVAKSAMNAIRRTAAEALISARTAIPNRRIMDFAPRIPAAQNITEPKIHVLARTKEQLEAVKDIINGDIYTSNLQLHSQYPNTRLKTSRLAKTVVPITNERLLVTDNGGLQEYHNNNDFILDYTLNAVNANTLAVLFDLGAKRIAISPEFELDNIKDMVSAYKNEHGNIPILEALVYGRYELMAMQHCIISHSLGEKKHCKVCKNNQFYIDDIKGVRYPICVDDECNNYIMNSRCENKELNGLFDIGVCDFRLEFLYEDAEHCAQIAQQYMRKLGML